MIRTTIAVLLGSALCGVTAPAYAAKECTVVVQCSGWEGTGSGSTMEDAEETAKINAVIAAQNAGKDLDVRKASACQVKVRGCH
jgi:hypothetical protein